MDADAIADDLASVLYTPEQIRERVVVLAGQIDKDYAGKDPLLVGVLNGAVMIMADLCRELSIDCEMDWMAVSSYGSGTKSSGVVRFLKDLSVDIHDRHVLVVEDIIDTGLTLSWLLSNLASRQPASLEVAAMFRKPEAVRTTIDCRYIGYDIPNEFVVGYGLDYDGHYRNFKGLGVLRPEVYS
ncbi:hypoxanthine phosphoribosyltransferase [Raineyella antarctica]|uniref:hypoxanthine phosphoribosyltransferase n=1 Tax=Raineyella antarctica TaxID=1577474 RepID=UPI001FE1CD08|nr:hypoxanthine phosphoribosyltransferase [Raineyella antarctica]